MAGVVSIVEAADNRGGCADSLGQRLLGQFRAAPWPAIISRNCEGSKKTRRATPVFQAILEATDRMLQSARKFVDFFA